MGSISATFIVCVGLGAGFLVASGLLCYFWLLRLGMGSTLLSSESVSAFSFSGFVSNYGSRGKTRSFFASGLSNDLFLSINGSSRKWNSLK